jgi:hypothetical protein
MSKDFRISKDQHPLPSAVDQDRVLPLPLAPFIPHPHYGLASFLTPFATPPD